MRQADKASRTVPAKVTEVAVSCLLSRHFLIWGRVTIKHKTQQML